jgi:hypothetical protein
LIQQLEADPGSLLLGHLFAFAVTFGGDAGHMHSDAKGLVVVGPAGADDFIAGDFVMGGLDTLLEAALEVGSVAPAVDGPQPFGEPFFNE